MKRIQALLDRFIETKMAVGVSALVMQNGRETFFGSAGVQTMGQTRPFRRDTLMLMYSMTKVVTGAAILHLIDEGRLSEDTPVCDIIPAFRDTRTLMPDGTLAPLERPLTVRHLLTMTSGIPYPGGNDPVSACYARAFASIPDPAALSTLRMAELIAQCPLRFQAGEQWLYGLSCEVLAGIIVALTGDEPEVYMRRMLFDPLGMTDTSFVVPAAKQPRLATVYNAAAGTFTPRTDLFGLGSCTNVQMGGAGLYSTLDDFARLGEMLRLGGAGVLSREAVRRMTANQLSDGQLATFSERGEGYGYGYLVRTLMHEDKNASYMEKRGAFGWNGMGGTTLRIDPARGLTVVFGVQRVPPEHDAFLPPLMSTIAKVLHS